jgi:hypothetical protein
VHSSKGPPRPNRQYIQQTTKTSEHGILLAAGLSEDIVTLTETERDRQDHPSSSAPNGFGVREVQGIAGVVADWTLSAAGQSLGRLSKGSPMANGSMH